MCFTANSCLAVNNLQPWVRFCGVLDTRLLWGWLRAAQVCSAALADTSAEETTLTGSCPAAQFPRALCCHSLAVHKAFTHSKGFQYWIKGKMSAITSVTHKFCSGVGCHAAGGSVHGQPGLTPRLDGAPGLPDPSVCQKKEQKILVTESQNKRRSTEKHVSMNLCL